MECYVKMHEIEPRLFKWENIQDISLSGKNAPLQNHHQFKPLQWHFVLLAYLLK